MSALRRQGLARNSQQPPKLARRQFAVADKPIDQPFADLQVDGRLLDGDPFRQRPIGSAGCCVDGLLIPHKGTAIMTKPKGKLLRFPTKPKQPAPVCRGEKPAADSWLTADDWAWIRAHAERETVSNG